MDALAVELTVGAPASLAEALIAGNTDDFVDTWNAIQMPAILPQIHACLLTSLYTTPDNVDTTLWRDALRARANAYAWLLDELGGGAEIKPTEMANGFGALCIFASVFEYAPGTLHAATACRRQRVVPTSSASRWGPFHAGELTPRCTHEPTRAEHAFAQDAILFARFQLPIGSRELALCANRNWKMAAHKIAASGIAPAFATPATNCEHRALQLVLELDNHNSPFDLRGQPHARVWRALLTLARARQWRALERWLRGYATPVTEPDAETCWRDVANDNEWADLYAQLAHARSFPAIVGCGDDRGDDGLHTVFWRSVYKQIANPNFVEMLAKDVANMRAPRLLFYARALPAIADSRDVHPTWLAIAQAVAAGTDTGCTPMFALLVRALAEISPNIMIDQVVQFGTVATFEAARTLLLMHNTQPTTWLALVAANSSLPVARAAIKYNPAFHTCTLRKLMRESADDAFDYLQRVDRTDVGHIMDSLRSLLLDKYMNTSDAIPKLLRAMAIVSTASIADCLDALLQEPLHDDLLARLNSKNALFLAKAMLARGTLPNKLATGVARMLAAACNPCAIAAVTEDSYNAHVIAGCIPETGWRVQCDESTLIVLDVRGNHITLSESFDSTGLTLLRAEPVMLDALKAMLAVKPNIDVGVVPYHGLVAMAQENIIHMTLPLIYRAHTMNKNEAAV